MVAGVLAAIEILIAFTQNRISFNFGVLGFLIAHGINRRSLGWRTAGIVLLILSTILIPVIAMIALTSGGTFTWTVFGNPVANPSAPLKLTIISAIVAYWVAGYWMLLTLMNNETRNRFIESNRAHR